MAKLLHKKKIILPEMNVASNVFQMANGLMFASKKKIKRGMYIPFPGKDIKFGASVTMFFLFLSFRNSFCKF